MIFLEVIGIAKRQDLMMLVLWRQGQGLFISRLIRNDDGIGSG